MDFVAFDVETANCDPGSICQVGVVAFDGGAVCERWSSLVDPEAEFDEICIDVHGITPAAVRGAPTFPQVAERLRETLRGAVVVTHTPFDRNSLRRAHQRYGLDAYDCRWLDTARVVRRAWPERRARGYGLAPVAAALGIEFRHHDAGEDARAAGEVLLRAMAETRTDLEEWYERARRRGAHSRGDRVVAGGLGAVPRRRDVRAGGRPPGTGGRPVRVAGAARRAA